MTHSEARLLLEEREYTFARTMAHVPHWYTLRKHWPDDADFCAVVLYIREAGQDILFRGRKFRVLDLGGYRYWTMGRPVLPVSVQPDRKKNTMLINCVPLNQDALAAEAALAIAGKLRVRWPEHLDR